MIRGAATRRLVVGDAAFRGGIVSVNLFAVLLLAAGGFAVVASINRVLKSESASLEKLPTR